jgi:hypothetical protein
MSEMTSDDFRFRLLDSRDLVFSGRTVEEDVSSVSPLPFFELFLWGPSDVWQGSWPRQQLELSQQCPGDESGKSFHRKLSRTPD